MPRIKVEVTQADIDKGVKRNCVRCPIALALARALGGYVRVYHRIFTTDDGSFVLPPSATRFIENFDGRRPVSPFSFTLDVPGG